MAFADTACPCGGKKDPHTLICPGCLDRSDPTDRRIYTDEAAFRVDSRRNAAIRLLAAARQSRRK